VRDLHEFLAILSVDHKVFLLILDRSVCDARSPGNSYNFLHELQPNGEQYIKVEVTIRQPLLGDKVGQVLERFLVLLKHLEGLGHSELGK
jgi:hypothetical protein